MWREKSPRCVVVRVSKKLGPGPGPRSSKSSFLWCERTTGLSVYVLNFTFWFLPWLMVGSIMLSESKKKQTFKAQLKCWVGLGAKPPSSSDLKPKSSLETLAIWGWGENKHRNKLFLALCHLFCGSNAVWVLGLELKKAANPRTAPQLLFCGWRFGGDALPGLILASCVFFAVTTFVMFF